MKNLNLVRLLLLFVGISGAFSVLFGAWFAHTGHALSVTNKASIETAQFYQFIHTLALFLTLVWYVNIPSKLLLVSGVCFCLGVLCFSGSLYIKVFFEFTDIGKLAPAGGILLALAWLLIVFVSKTKLANLIKN